MIDWNRDGRVDPAEVALTLYMISQEETEELEEPEEGLLPLEADDLSLESDDGEGRNPPRRRRRFGRM